MRTTLTLDEDVARRLKAVMRQDGKSLKTAVNDLLRLSLSAKRATKQRERFRVEARDLGELRPGLSLDNVGDLLEQLEGPRHR